MSLDGSFSCEFELQRLLDRCTALRSDARLLSLAEKGGALLADEVVEALADAFLHPSYTIPIMGCFRSLSRGIVERVVSLLQVVPSLESECAGNRDEVGEEDVHVVDFYVGRGRGRRLHELASLAFVRVLDLAPFLLQYVLSYYRFAPPPYRCLLPVINIALEVKDINYILDVIRVSYRYLVIEPKVFSQLWDWSCFLDLVQWLETLNASNKISLDTLLDIRWCSVQILSVVLKLSDRVVENFGLEPNAALSCLLRWEDFCQDTSLEKAGWYLQASNVEDESCHSLGFKINYCLDSSINFSSLISSKDYREIKLQGRNCRKKVPHDLGCLSSPFILTSAMTRSLEMGLLAVSQKWPILLHGPSGVGKTTLIRKLAEINQNQVLFIHVDEQMDSKTLIGSYVCTAIPGEFRWQPGSLTQAILNGFWVVFEDIDKAPNDVKSILLPLLEGAGAFVTGHGEAINVPETFCLFATVSSSKNDSFHVTEGSALWRKVMVCAPGKGDLLDLVNGCYPSLVDFSSKLVETFEKVNSICSRIGGIGSAIMSSGTLIRFLLRDLLKWCNRIAGLDLNSGVVLPIFYCKRIFQEAVDIFGAFSPSLEHRIHIARKIAYVWNVPVSEADDLFNCSKPDLKDLSSGLQVGRVVLPYNQLKVDTKKRPFVGIRSSLQVLERIACSVKYKEPVLLVGETGTGKTTLVQNLAVRLGYSLTVMNLSQQSDVADLLGGYKPSDMRSICIPLYREFRELFCKTYSEKENKAFIDQCEEYVIKKNWKKLLHGCQRAVNHVRKQVAESLNYTPGAKRKRRISEEILHDWNSFALRVDSAFKQITSSSGMLFTFVEGAFVTALKEGHWVLLDEVNLAPPEVLQRIIGVLDGDSGSLCLTERGDIDYIERHPDFRIFACMNPATDAGKRELPFSFRSRFTEYFVDDVLDDGDLTLFVNQYMGDSTSWIKFLNRIVYFYKEAKKESEERLQDSANQKPQFSLRSLARALDYAKKAEKDFGLPKALYDGFCMFFLTLLDGSSANLMNKMILSDLLDKNMPPNIPFDGYFIEKSDHAFSADPFVENYVLTKSVKEQLRNLARAIYIKRYPVLLQGPTSSGKTSLVHYLASVTGHEFVRINNHEHTDLQEYFGSYTTDSHGRLQFQEGVLVKAVRKGHWIVLDELNLAPSDVLEALNRLLDDNRELFVPELKETVFAHPEFMLFATQNPPTVYGGRKVLSRAFRNRFVEVHVDEIPEDELTLILEKRCKIPETYALKMVEVMKDLQLHRQNSKIFAGKHGFITPRDLFRWAERFRMFGKSYEDLARDGYFLLAERLRDDGEKNVVRETLERRLRVKLVVDDLYKLETGMNIAAIKLRNHSQMLTSLGNVIWTKSMWRLYFLVERCFQMREPVLLVGETGGGKTSVCQLLSAILGSRLHILNCHQYTETSDFIGGFYPVRDRSRLMMEFRQHAEHLKQNKIFLRFSENSILSSEINQASSTLKKLHEIVDWYRQEASFHPDIRQQDLDIFEELKENLILLHEKWQTIFLWHDGPLVQAMKDGDLFLVDEISLADDSVLERLNSVLEPERKLSLPEKGGAAMEKITAHPNFFLLATMNPGGDYGKKELSPALRNRFTEIWVSPVNDISELRVIATERFRKSELSCFTNCMLNFWEWFNQLQTGRPLTVRDLLSWVSFINVTAESLGSQLAFLHGAFLVVLDGLSLGTSISRSDANRLRELSLSFLLKQLQEHNIGLVNQCLPKMESYGWGDGRKHGDILHSIGFHSEHMFGINPFYIPKGSNGCSCGGFEFLAPTTHRNALRVLRAMQLPKPVLLEGSPGVGKTSLVAALAAYSGHNVVRINLSEQTDMMDLLGSDLPLEGKNGMEFSWSDGILLQALKNGSWVLLDELNLAPQSVLEGLNAILDHRAEVYIPELGLTFKCPSSFRIFACQNPFCQGGGRKGLPKSFLNRFTKVYVDELLEDDYVSICQSLYPSISTSLLSKLISFNNHLYEDVVIHHKFGHEGFPWEFNLRDIMRSCQIIQGAPENSKLDRFLNIVYLQRLRTVVDREEVLKLFEAVFGVRPSISQIPKIYINPGYLIIGSAYIERNHFQPTKILKSQLQTLPAIHQSLEAALHCVQQQWLCILTGPSSSGKTSLIRLLAQMTGNTLHELNLSSASDVSELLGCFEQYNYFRSRRALVSQIECYVTEYFSLQVKSDWKFIIHERKEMFCKWFSFLAAENCGSSASMCAFPEPLASGSAKSLGSLLEIIEQLRHDLEQHQLPVSWSYTELSKTMETVIKLQRYTMQLSTTFEWVAGGLIKAIEHGDWVVLDNANLCSPTVLDRINSLVEPGRSITVSECGLIDGKPVILQAHPKFRMFLTVDPKYGEVSRAMRNRGVEIFLMQPNWFSNKVSGGSKKSEKHDTIKFLILAGIPFNKLVLAMTDAHIHAKGEGLKLGVHITLLELSRWVQLFKQLLMNGNQLIWSLQLSWEHIYLSSLGEAEGVDAVMQGKLSFLSDTELSNLGSRIGFSSSLPGGWPRPHTLQKFVWYSREATVRQNCIYLESLADQCASYGLYISAGKTYQSSWLGKVKPSIIPVNMLQRLLFPNCSDQQKFECKGLLNFDLEKTNQMIYIAASWTIEQATESDLFLYIQWLEWYHARLQPYCNFFMSFLAILKQELKHPIWDCILQCRKKISSYLKDDITAQHIPLLASNSFGFFDSDLSSKKCQKHLQNAINGVGLLRCSIKQWNDEDDYNFGDEDVHTLVASVLRSLRCLEKQVLAQIVKSQKLFMICWSIIENHVLFWKYFMSCRFEHMFLALNALKKVSLRLKPRFPEEVAALLEEILRLEDSSLRIFNGEKPLLWVHGGHPLLPSSPAIFDIMCQLRTLCDSIWPRRNYFSQRLEDNHTIVEVVLSTNAELRHLSHQGFCMMSCIISKGDQDDEEVLHHLGELHQRLSIRCKHEKRNVEVVFDRIANEGDSLEDTLATSCCNFAAEVLYRQSSLNFLLAAIPLLDRRSFILDIVLLQGLSRTYSAGDHEGYQVLVDLSELLRHALNYSLNSSSRPPLDFLPHQTILWILDAWNTKNSVCAELASYVTEMWFNWHSSLWSYSSESVKGLSEDSFNLACLTRASILDRILEENFSIKDYHLHRLKLSGAAKNLWQEAPLQQDLFDILRSAAGSLFKQIIFAHEKSFQEDDFGEINSLVSQLLNNGAKEETLQLLTSLISSSTHGKLTCLIDQIIKPLLSVLYFESLPDDKIYKLGCSWTYIGLLRFNLLNPDGPDPVVKYMIRHSEVLKKRSLLELEIEVRNECENVTGGSSNGAYEEQIFAFLKKLDRDQKQLKSKIVHRPESSKYKSLQSLCAAFLVHVSGCIQLLEDLMCSAHQMVIDRAQNWQVVSASFISRLSKEFAEYVDITQPIQVAVYEMKLGLAIAVCDALEREFLTKIQEGDIKKIMNAINSLMQFPSLHGRDHPIELHDMVPRFLTSDLNAVEFIWMVDVDLVRKLFEISCGTSSGKAVYFGQLQITINHIHLIHAAHSVCSSLLIDSTSFQLLKEIFDHFVSAWMGMKSQKKEKEERDAQYYKFKPRSVVLNDVLKEDLSLLFESDGILTYESEDKLTEEEFTMLIHPPKIEITAEEWENVPETIVNNVVLVHDQLFGLNNLDDHQDVRHITDEQRLNSFMDSYTSGMPIIKALHPLHAFSLDDSLGLEHLLYVCLRYEKTVAFPCQPTHAYNIYKDSNGAAMFKMVKPLTIIQQRARSLLDGWQDHPGLKKILDVTESLLAIPMKTPLSKALLGLQILVSRIQSLQESTPMFSFSDQLQPVLDLLSSWQKIELECWPVLLDEIQQQHDLNAGKLWFPLHSVLHRNQSIEVEEESFSTIQSVENFIQTANIGEFKRRLDLLLAFYGQIKHGVCLKAYSGSAMERNLNILYNAFGYYVQFLPVVLEHIEAGRKCIVKELKELLKLFHWEQPYHRSSIENFRRTRQKIWKLIQKFNDILQQPVMLILSEAKLKKERLLAWLDQKISDDIDIDLLQFPMDFLSIGSKERLLWSGHWMTQAASALECVCNGSAHFTSIMPFISSGLACENLKKEWSKGWRSVQNICRNAAEFSCIWKRDTKSLKKRRALGELMKVLERCGLSRHRTGTYELEPKLGQLSSLFLQPSYEILHLVQQEYYGSMKSSRSSPSSDPGKHTDDHGSLKWEDANKYYFENLAMIHQIKHACLSFHKDLTLEQVNQIASFLEHLIGVLQEQRYVAYNAFKHLKKLRKQLDLLNGIGIDARVSNEDQPIAFRISVSEGMGSNSSMSGNQYAVIKCMWQHKHLFDELLAMSKDMCLLLTKVKRCHLNTCASATGEADAAYILLDRFIPVFEGAKESLNFYLLGRDRVVTTSTACVPFVVSKQLEQLVEFNFQMLISFKEDVDKLGIPSAKGHLLSKFGDLINKGKVIMENFRSEVQRSNQLNYDEDTDCMENLVMLKASFNESFGEINEFLMDSLRKIDVRCRRDSLDGQVSPGNIVLWKDLFESIMSDLHLDHLDHYLSKTVVKACELANFPCHTKPEVTSQLESQLKDLSLFLDLILNFAEGMLFEFLDAHRTTAEMTHVLAQIFALLISKGFGTAEEPTESSVCDGSQAASGTGMGEGEGIKDVSDEIDDEAQLLGTEKQDGPDDSAKAPSNKDQGIEMDEDFTAEMFSVSEESEDDHAEDEDVNLETRMGETGYSSQVVDEKPWHEDDDDRPDTSDEKYESGPSVKETDSTSRELKAKEDNALQLEDETEQLDKDEFDRPSEKDEKSDGNFGDENPDNMEMDKKDAFQDPTGVQFNEQEQKLEDTNMEEPQDLEMMEEDDSGPHASDEEMGDEDDQPSTSGHISEEITTEVDENNEFKEEGDKEAENKDSNLEDPSKGTLSSGDIEPVDGPFKGAESAEPMNNLRGESTGEPEIYWSNSTDMNNGATPSKSFGHDEMPNTELALSGSNNGPSLASDQAKPLSSESDNLSFKRTQANPFRSIGDAMEEWKERVKISADMEELKSNAPIDFEDEGADEYQYVSEQEKGTTQALGSATSDQMKNNVEDKKSGTDEGDIMKKENIDRLEGVNESLDLLQLEAAQPSMPRQRVEQMLDTTLANDDALTKEAHMDDINDSIGDVLTFKSSYMAGNISPLDTLSNEELKPFHMEEASEEATQKAAESWQKYELATTRPSQELAEQLRLVLEPNRASKLQGDYKTGKRVDMRKVIQYIASNYQKDKIWLRRTRPNKREYQVVVAVDDSRSMSESNFEDFAIKALVTVCRAMSLLEVGQLAVASFGKKGNIKLLHDFEHPFTRETGVQILSNLTFKQDNTIDDEPMIHLLQYLNNMLDAAVARARMPSGENPLHQLILIIADGHFHEKNLKRQVRDILSRRRMVAYIVLDSPRESIMGLEEVSFEGKKPIIRKHLDSFPFPYYIVLKNIEGLPRTLGDLLRQWFELMQSVRE